MKYGEDTINSIYSLANARGSEKNVSEPRALASVLLTFMLCCAARHGSLLKVKLCFCLSKDAHP